MIELNPLTMEELRNMNGKPVWVKCCNPQKYISPPIGWRILEKSVTGHFGVWDGESCLAERDYGTYWFAYACEPIKIDRIKWDMCELCKTCSNCWGAMDDKHGIPCNTCVEFSNFSPVSYCRYCGRPMTEQAWKELERKIFDEV